MGFCSTLEQVTPKWIYDDGGRFAVRSIVADLSLRWAYRSLYWFCHAQAQMNVISVLNIGSFPYRRVRLTFGVSPIATDTFNQREI